MLSPYLWVYFLGVWLIGPFTDAGSCDNARQYQIDSGGAVQEQVSVCYRVLREEWEKD